MRRVDSSAVIVWDGSGMGGERCRSRKPWNGRCSRPAVSGNHTQFQRRGESNSTPEPNGEWVRSDGGRHVEVVMQPLAVAQVERTGLGCCVPAPNTRGLPSGQ